MVHALRNSSGSKTRFHILKGSWRGFTGALPKRPVIGTPRWRWRKFDFHTLWLGRGSVGVRGDSALLAMGIKLFVLVDLRMNLVKDSVAVARVSEGFLCKGNKLLAGLTMKERDIICLQVFFII